MCISIIQLCLNVVHFQTNNKCPALVKMVVLVVGKIPHVWLLQVLHISICVPTIWRQPAKRRIVQLVRLARETKRPILLDSAAVSIFVVRLVELINTVFVNATNIPTNIETAVDKFAIIIKLFDHSNIV